MQTQSKRTPSQVPQSQKTTLPFAPLPIGLSISSQKFHQISRTMNMTMLNNNEQNTQVIITHNLKTSQNYRQMKKTGTKVSLMMQSFSIITILLRKVTEYVVSTLLTLKKLKINNTVLTILHKVLNIIFLSQIVVTATQNQNSTRDSKIKTYTYPHPPLSRTYVHGTVEAEEEPGT